MFIHGGGYIGGSTFGLTKSMPFSAEQSGATVISIDYRLAPEAPFPAAFMIVKMWSNGYTSC